ncbi:hypothetical protein [Stappia sp. ICDLI1TA098]
MTLPYQLLRETRSSGPQAFDGASVTFGPFQFRIFDTADVIVQVKHAGEAGWADTEAVAATKKDPAAAHSFFTITLDAVHPATCRYRMISQRLHERSMALARGSGFNLSELEKEITKQGSVLQELRREANAQAVQLGRTLRLPEGDDVSPLPGSDARAGHILAFDPVTRIFADVVSEGLKAALPLLQRGNAADGAGDEPRRRRF